MRILKNYWWEGSTSTAIPLASTSNFVSKHNKIGDITFGASLKEHGKDVGYVSLQGTGTYFSKSSSVKCAYPSHSQLFSLYMK
jgi:hypothetical protein